MSCHVVSCRVFVVVIFVKPELSGSSRYRAYSLKLAFSGKLASLGVIYITSLHVVTMALLHMGFTVRDGWK